MSLSIKREQAMHMRSLELQQRQPCPCVTSCEFETHYCYNLYAAFMKNNVILHDKHNFQNFGLLFD